MTDEIITDQPADELSTPAEPRYTSEAPRSKFVSLEWPVEFDGKVYHQIRVGRVTGKQMRDFLQKLSDGSEDILPPMVECPIEVWNALDADDQQAVDEAAAEFMLKRLKLLHDAAAALDGGKQQEI